MVAARPELMRPCRTRSSIQRSRSRVAAASGPELTDSSGRLTRYSLFLGSELDMLGLCRLPPLLAREVVRVLGENMVLRRVLVASSPSLVTDVPREAGGDRRRAGEPERLTNAWVGRTLPLMAQYCLFCHAN